MKAVAILLAAAAGLWLVMFSPWTRQHVNFWAMMAASSGALAVAAMLLTRKRTGQWFAFRPLWLVVGVVSAAVLYMVFLAGHAISTAVLGFAGGQVSWIYTLRSAAPTAVVVLLLLVIAPAEEIFWRGFIQTRLSDRLGRWPGMLLAAAAYCLVHVWASNAMLLAAAGICGLFWGWMMLRCRSLWPGIISHVVWDIVIFVVWPIGETGG